MSLFKEVKCFCYHRENNNEFKEEEFDCTVVCQSGSISFGIYEMGIQFLLDEQILIKSLIDNKAIKAKGIYMCFTNESILPVKCNIKIDLMASEINFEILNTSNFIRIKTKDLKKILDVT